MSRGLEAVYRLKHIGIDRVIYEYSGEDFNNSYDKKLARLYDGQIEILLSAFEEADSIDVIKSEKVSVLKCCYYAEKNSEGVDILAMFTIRNILRKYKETSEMPREGHWIV